jgi:hypothetical protein
MFNFDPDVINGYSDSEWQKVTLGQAILLFKESTGVTSLSYARNVLRYNLGDGRQFPTRMVARLIREWHEQASP